LQEGLIVGGVEQDKNDTRRFGINVELPLGNLMTHILGYDTRYRWIEDKGVINLLPVEEPKILSAHIPKFKAVKSNTRELVKELVRSKEFKDAAKTIGVEFGGLYRFASYHEDQGEIKLEAQDDCINCNSTQNNKKFSIDVDNLTVRQILNEIARSYNGWGYLWRYSEKPIVDSEGNVKIYFYITVAP
jgi:hypothetical protein